MKYPGAHDNQIKSIELSQKIAKQFPNLITNYYWCHISAGLYTEISGKKSQHEEKWAVYETTQQGYKWADKKIPMFYEDQLEELMATTKNESEELNIYKLIKEMKEK